MTKIPSSILKQAIRAVHLFSKGAAAAKERANHGDMIFLKNHRSAEKRWISSLPVSTSINESIYTHTRRRNRQRNKSFLFFYVAFRFLFLFRSPEMRLLFAIEQENIKEPPFIYNWSTAPKIR